MCLMFLIQSLTSSKIKVTLYFWEIFLFERMVLELCVCVLTLHLYWKDYSRRKQGDYSCHFLMVPTTSYSQNIVRIFKYENVPPPMLQLGYSRFQFQKFCTNVADERRISFGEYRTNVNDIILRTESTRNESKNKK